MQLVLSYAEDEIAELLCREAARVTGITVEGLQAELTICSDGRTIRATVRHGDGRTHLWKPEIFR